MSPLLSDDAAYCFESSIKYIFQTAQLIAILPIVEQKISTAAY